MDKHGSWLLAGALVLLSGCTLMPKYDQPQMPVPTAWSRDAAETHTVSTTNAPGAAEIPWQSFYNDAQLQSVMTLAWTNNRDLVVAALTVEKTRAMYRIQRADLLPTLNAVGYGTRQEVFANVAAFDEKVDLEYYSVGLGISSYELDLFGRIRSLKERALEEYLGSEQAQRSLQIALLAEIAGAYLNLAADHELLQLAQDTWASQKMTYELIMRRVEVGDASELELYQAQTRVDAARVDIAKYTGLVALDENTLNLLVGTQVPEELLPRELGSIALLKNISVGLPSQVLQRRPDVLQAESRLRAANADIGAARAAFFPSITLSTSIGTMDGQLSGLFKGGSGVWNFTPQITVPIFNTGRNTANLDAAKAGRAICLAQYEKAIQTAFKEVANALAQRGSILDQLAAQESLVAATAASYSLSDARYRNGIDGYLTVLDSQRSLYGAQQALIAARLAQLANLVTLYKVLGGG